MDEFQTNDNEFKAGFDNNIVRRTSTLRLKASYHLINYIMMSVCKMMIGDEDSLEDVDEAPNAQTDIDRLEQLATDRYEMQMNPYKFI